MKIGKEDLGPNMSRLVVERMATLMAEKAMASQQEGPFGGAATMAALILSGDVPVLAGEALQWAKGACQALRDCAGGHPGPDEEIAGFVLKKLEETGRLKPRPQGGQG